MLFIFRQHETVPIEFRENAWEMLLVALQSHATGLAKYVDGELDPSLRLGHLNCLKMISYLVCQFVEIYESENVDPTTAGMSKVGMISKNRCMFSASVHTAGILML